MKKFIPPFLFFVCIALMTAIHFVYRPAAFVKFPFNLTGIVMIVIGLAMGAWVSRVFRKATTQINTFKDPVTFVSHGLFRFSRNPIYLGFAIILTGAAVLFGTLVSFLFPLIFILFANFWYIPFEEKNMERLFGDKYLQYKLRVRRWF